MRPSTEKLFLNKNFTFYICEYDWPRMPSKDFIYKTDVNDT